jgi:hypothetical protein
LRMKERFLPKTLFYSYFITLILRARNRLMDGWMNG